jgi:integrase
LLALRPIDIQMNDTEGVWVYRPEEHKNAHRDKPRVILLGPLAQEILQPFLANRPLDAFMFSPREANAERRARMHAARRTPMSCGNKPGSNRSDQPQRPPRDFYTPNAYHRAIQYACDQAYPPTGLLGRRPREDSSKWEARLKTEGRFEDLKAWRRDHRWHPYQLRHSAATRLRREFGLEAAQLALGHSSALLTDAVYAERDESRIVEIMRKIG